MCNMACHRMTGSAWTCMVHAGRCIMSAGGNVPKEIFIFIREGGARGGRIVGVFFCVFLLIWGLSRWPLAPNMGLLGVPFGSI